jgi:SAM-dependent methyltransferase
MGKRYFDARSRAEFAWRRYQPFLDGRVLDVGSGGSARFFRNVLSDGYVAADISRDRATPDVVCDFERRNLPFQDGSFDTVLCFDVLEHVDRPHRLLDECLRVSKRYVIVSLPNNWPGFFWNVVAGHNLVHRKGYGLPVDEPPVGERHKWFFNIEEAASFLSGRAIEAGARVLASDYVFEREADSLLRFAPLARFGVPGYPAVLGMTSSHVLQKRPRMYVPFLVVKYFVALPFSWIEEVFKRAVWGWGSFRYENVFCRQLWTILEKRHPLHTAATDSETGLVERAVTSSARADVG